MTKVLNLDDLETSVERSVVVGGKTYMMEAFSVEDFINQMKEIEEIGDKVPSASEMMETTLKMIQRAFPTMPNEVLRKLKTHQIDALYEFLKGKTEEEVERAATEGNSEGEA